MRLSRAVSVVPVLCLLMAAATFAGKENPMASGAVEIDVDCARWVDHPLVKTKFGIYNSGFVPGHLETYRDRIELFEEACPNSLRFDGGLGSPPTILLSTPPMISGRPPELRYDFREADALVDLMLSRDVALYWCYSYVPASLVPPGKGFRHPPSDLKAWGDAVGAVARHFKETGRRIRWHEIYNEPDNADFFAGSLEGYCRMYAAAVRAIREVDPDAVVGGPALAFTDDWIGPFLDYVISNRLPLDFFSFHYYPGVSYKAGTLRGVVDSIHAELGKRPELRGTELHLTEYNSLPIHYPVDGPQQKHALAAQLLRDYEYLVSQPDMTQVHWAQFLDTGGGNWSGMVSLEGRRKAAFNAYRVYAMMPVDRRAMRIEGPPGMGGMASSDGARVAAVVWNLTGSDQTVEVRMGSLPFANGDLRVFRIDAGHASWGDNPAREELVPSEMRSFGGATDLAWNGRIPDGGIVFLEFRSLNPAGSAVPKLPGEVVRVLHDFPERGSTAYADFDRRTWIARLGSGAEYWADTRVGVIAEALPERLQVGLQLDGTPSLLRPGAFLGVRLDYAVSATTYGKAALWQWRAGETADLSDGTDHRAVPWGTRRNADVTVPTPDFEGFLIDVRELAPPDWTGRCVLSFLLHNAAPGIRARIDVTDMLLQ